MKLTHVVSSTLLAACLVGGMAKMASAQVLNTPTTAVQSPFSVKLGVLFPSTGPAKKYGGSTQFSAGLDYALAKTTASNPILPSIYLDYTGGSSNSGHIYTTGIGFAVRAYTSSVGTNNQSPYVGAGIGIYDSDGQKSYTNSSSDFNLGGKVFIGEELGGGFFIEGNYQLLPSSKGITDSGFGLQGGFRF